DITEFFKKSFMICDRVYKVFYVKQVKKDKNTFTAHCLAISGVGLEGIIPMNNVLEWLVSPSTNKEARVSKLFSRIALSLSSTIPTMVFTCDQIKVSKDI